MNQKKYMLSLKSKYNYLISHIFFTNLGIFVYVFIPLRSKKLICWFLKMNTKTYFCVYLSINALISYYIIFPQFIITIRWYAYRFQIYQNKSYNKKIKPQLNSNHDKTFIISFLYKCCFLNIFSNKKIIFLCFYVIFSNFLL
ncbi:hypothetical protein EDEG_03505 [Edhazardia aedis USNM 41457]|uniref:Uncharacterized protein n=1 Tax=Edhazardia aedis (strain USNM 41457) TaxID=1003232 RepID=J9DL09_EDHAE|nr:hypothetical protein EDEG_03505 [Edhazardia aedis USNM 41457]|eukprot:EJW02042.1 hypothetical protein EDEG_03505 [Edhazardia aedis USNM 41457]